MSTSPEIEIPEAESDDPQEVFAFYGLAAYAASVFEAELTNLLAGAAMAAQRPSSETEVDALFSQHYDRTLGQLIRLVRQRVPITRQTEELITRSLDRRNWLSHHFFRDHAEDFMSAVGRRVMIAELRGMAALFRQADAEAEGISGPLFVSLGVTPERVASTLDTLRGAAERRDRAT